MGYFEIFHLDSNKSYLIFHLDSNKQHFFSVQYPCWRVYVAQIHVKLSSQIFEFWPETTRRHQDKESCALTN